MLKLIHTMMRPLLISLLAATIGHANPSLSIRTLALEKGAMPDWHIQAGEQAFAPLPWETSQPSAAVTTPAARKLTLFTKHQDPEGEAEYRPATAVEIPLGATEILLLGSPAKEGGEPTLIPIADHYQKAEFNDWLVINLSDKEVRLHYGKDQKPIRLQSEESGIYPIQATPGQGGEAVAEMLHKGRMKKIYSTFWAAPPKQRSLVLFSTQGERVRLRRIIDFLPLGK